MICLFFSTKKEEESRMDQENLNFSKEDLTLIKSFDGKSAFYVCESFKLLTLRKVHINSHESIYSSILFFFKDEQIYHLKDNKKYEKITLKELLDYVTIEMSQIRNLFQQYHEEIDSLEDILFERKPPSYFIHTWFTYKKEMSNIDRTFNRNSLVLNEFKDESGIFSAETLDKLEALIENLESEKRNCTNEISRLDSIFNFYTTIKNDKLNLHIYLLAIVSGIFLPLNLIVGFFGMNTDNMFFKDNPHATQNVIWIIIFLFFMLLLGLPMLKLVDHILFNRIFGRTNIYKSIHQKLNSINLNINDELK